MDGLTECIKSIGDDFSKKPLHYPSKAAIICRLREELQNNIGDTVHASATYDPDNVTGYKQDYIDRIANLQSIRNVIPNANVGTPDNAYRQDLIVLTEPNSDIEVNFRNGGFYYPEEAVETVVICKYVRGQNTPDTTLESTDTDAWGRYSRELEKLTNIDADRKRFVIFNTRNIFQQEDTDEYSTKAAQNRYENLVDKCEQHGIQVNEFHPDVWR